MAELHPSDTPLLDSIQNLADRRDCPPGEIIIEPFSGKEVTAHEYFSGFRSGRMINPIFLPPDLLGIYLVVRRKMIEDKVGGLLYEQIRVLFQSSADLGFADSVLNVLGFSYNERISHGHGCDALITEGRIRIEGRCATLLKPDGIAWGSYGSISCAELVQKLYSNGVFCSPQETGPIEQEDFFDARVRENIKEVKRIERIVTPRRRMQVIEATAKKAAEWHSTGRVDELIARAKAQEDARNLSNRNKSAARVEVEHAVSVLAERLMEELPHNLKPRDLSAATKMARSMIKKKLAY
jgi:hypothetical protein